MNGAPAVIKDSRDFKAKKAFLVTYKPLKEGAKEEVLVGWLRGIRKKQEKMEKKQTYIEGTKQFRDRSSRCLSFTRVWRQYKVSKTGRQFLDSPHDVFVLDQTHKPLHDKTATF